jgi:hypothetical protein
MPLEDNTNAFAVQISLGQEGIMLDINILPGRSKQLLDSNRRKTVAIAKCSSASASLERNHQ